VKLRLLALLALVALASPPAAALATAPRASLTDIENDVMCVSCRESLAVAQSPQAYSERAYIRALINRGETRAQIERELVAQYGPAVLARPPAHGFNLTVYVLPPAILLLGAALLAIVLPRWRRRTRDRTPPAPAPALNPADARRLEDDLSHFGG
jgi:cytochrome c-type biogenesis protein CcmH